MLSRILLLAVVVGALYMLLFGLTDAQIDGFQRWRRVWTQRLVTIERSVTSFGKK